MPFITKIEECDQTLLAELQTRYATYLPSVLQKELISISLCNLHEAGILERYHHYRPDTLRKVLSPSQEVKKSNIINLAALDPRDSLLTPYFNYIEKRHDILETIDLLGCLKRHGLLHDESMMLFISQDKERLVKLVCAIETLAKMNHPMNVQFCMETLTVSRDPDEYANIMIELLYTKKDFSEDESKFILQILKHVRFHPAAIALEYFRKLKALHLLDVFSFNPSYGYTDFESLLNSIKHLEENNIPLTDRIVNMLHQHDTAYSFARAIVYFNKSFQNDERNQIDLTVDKMDVILTLLSECMKNSHFYSGVLVLRENKLVKSSYLYIPGEIEYAITHLNPLTPGCIRALMNIPSNEKKAVDIFCNFVKSNPELNKPSNFISLCESLEALLNILELKISYHLQKRFLSVTQADFNALIEASNVLMRTYLDGKTRNVTTDKIISLFNKFTAKTAATTSNTNVPVIVKNTSPSSLPVQTQSENSNKRTRPDDKPSIDDSKPVAKKNATNSVTHVKSALSENSFLNSMNSNTTTTSNVNISQVPPTYSDCKTESDVVMFIESANLSDRQSGTRKH